MQNKTVEGQISHKAFDVEKNFFFLVLPWSTDKDWYYDAALVMHCSAPFRNRYSSLGIIRITLWFALVWFVLRAVLNSYRSSFSRTFRDAVVQKNLGGFRNNSFCHVLLVCSFSLKRAQPLTASQNTFKQLL